MIKYFAFDWDDNLLYMPTKMHVQEIVGDTVIDREISSGKFAEIRGKDNWIVPNYAFVEASDKGPRGENAFLEDTKTAIQNGKWGPSWESFKECLINANIFMIITARGHEPNTIRETVFWIINNVLTEVEQKELLGNIIKFNIQFDVREYNTELIKMYLDSCTFIGVDSDFFRNKYGDIGREVSPEEGKKVAIKDFIERINKFGKRVNSDVSLGYSDDDLKNVSKLTEFFMNLSTDSEFGVFVKKYTVYNTNNPSSINRISIEKNI